MEVVKISLFDNKAKEFNVDSLSNQINRYERTATQNSESLGDVAGLDFEPNENLTHLQMAVAANFIYEQKT